MNYISNISGKNVNFTKLKFRLILLVPFMNLHFNCQIFLLIYLVKDFDILSLKRKNKTT